MHFQMNKDILLIGASGFVGSRLIEILGTEHCWNIDKNPSPFHNEVTTIQNICDPGLIDAMKPDARTVVLLAAEHRDDVNPISLYYEVNVQGTQNVLDAMDTLGITNIIFTSSVAVYGLNKVNPDETHPADPFNHYGKSKWQAEEELRKWLYKDPGNRSLTIIRPTVIFGERNRGNVYNLLKQITSGRFLIIGKGNNIKSMAYVGNVAAFIKYCLESQKPGYSVYNYVDKPDYRMKELVSQVEKSLNKKLPSVRIPYALGMIGGYSFDLLSTLTGKKYSISSVRIKKFCATTEFDSTAAHTSGFKVPFSISEGLSRTLQFEFANKEKQ